MNSLRKEFDVRSTFRAVARGLRGPAVAEPNANVPGRVTGSGSPDPSGGATRLA